MIKRKYISIFFLFYTYIVFAQNYIWPTTAGQQLSSTFGEYRQGHFHAGIDIKTNYSTGYPVFAVGNGYVWRVRTSPFGYGKALYLKLDDGNLAVYGHLDDFIRPIAAYVKSEQILKMSYSTDIYFRKNDLRVSRGDTIAYTGTSGTKYPHLHFEIRDENNQLINPLNTNLTIHDPTIPTIKSIAIVPLETKSRVNGLPTTQIIDVEYIHKKLFRIDETIIVTGKIAIEIKAHDTVWGVPNKYNPYGIKLFIDDSLYFQTQYDLFDFNETRLVNIDRNYRLSQQNAGLFNRLWKFDNGSNLRFYSKSPGDGILDLPSGNHDIKVDVFDRNGNTSTLTFKILVADVFQPNAEKVEQTIKEYIVTFTNLPPDSVTITADWVSANGSALYPAIIDSVQKDSAALSTYIARPGNRETDILKITIKNQQTGLSIPNFLNFACDDDIESAVPELRYIHQSKTFLCEITFPDAPEAAPLFYIQTEQDFLEYRTIPVSPVRYLTMPIHRNLIEKTLAFELRYNSSPQKILRVPVHLNCITPDSPRTIMTLDSLLTVTFNSSSIYDTLINWIDKTDSKTLQNSNTISTPYIINPSEQPLKSDIRLQYKIPAEESNLDQIGLYRRDKEKWDYIKDQRKSELLTITAETDELGTVALLRDTEPPIITNIYPGNGGRFRVNDISIISATVKDLLSGIQDDHAITVTLDGQRLYAEYNAPKDHIRYKLSQRLDTGSHHLTITVSDNAKNRITATSIFTIY